MLRSKRQSVGHVHEVKEEDDRKREEEERE